MGYLIVHPAYRPSSKRPHRQDNKDRNYAGMRTTNKATSIEESSLVLPHGVRVRVIVVLLAASIRTYDSRQRSICLPRVVTGPSQKFTWEKSGYMALPLDDGQAKQTRHENKRGRNVE